MRDEGRFGQGQGWLLLGFFYFSTFRGRPSPLPASWWLTGASFCAVDNLTFRNWPSFPKHEIPIFHIGAPSIPIPTSTFPALADAILPLAVPGASSAAALGSVRDSSVGFEVPVAGGGDRCRGGQFQGLSLLQGSVPQVLEGEWNTNITHRKLGARQLQKLSGPVRAAWRPALAEDKEGVLHQDLHTHLEEREWWKDTSTQRHSNTKLVCKLLLSVPWNLTSNPELFSSTLNIYDKITATIHQPSSHSDFKYC